MNWHVQLLGRLALSQGSRVITHFESRKVAALLAYLALFAQRPHPREELMELLWPEVDPELGKPRMRQALSSLRRQLEPPGTPYGSVLTANRHEVRLNPDAVTCDALEFERLIRLGRHAEAKALYIGELLPGFYEDWILLERERLAELSEDLPPGPVLAGETGRSRGKEPSGETGQVFLPCYLTEFFGREIERQELAARLPATRLLVITGPGGCGKTRLAVEVARQVAPDYDTVAFAPLAECAAPDQIPEHLRAALHLPASTVPALEQIASVFGSRKTLLALDNFEHLVASGGAHVAEALLARLPGLTCVITSRRLPGIAGEREFPLAPLPVPPDEAALVETAENPSVALFLSRAQAARPGFQLTERNRADLVALCRALEGLPLALELAASRIRALAPSEMRSQIEDRFQWLARSGPGADKEARQRSLAAALEWSWRLLSPAQQKFLASLSVFRGGWTASLAAEVCEAADARERLESLVMDSLLSSEEMPDGAMRFRMLETVRAFARERLNPAGAASLRKRHRAAFLALAVQAENDGGALLAETDNLIAALETAIEDEKTETALALCVTLDDRWMALAGMKTALSLLRRALELPGGNREMRVRALDLTAYLALHAGETAEASQLMEASLRAAGDRPAERLFALLARARAGINLFEPPESVGGLLEEAVRLARAAGDARNMGTALRLRGILANRRRDFAGAQRDLSEALALLESAGDRRGAIYALDNLASLASQQGNLGRALELYGECQQRALEIGDFAYQAKVFQNLAATTARQSRWEESLAAGRECLRRNRALGDEYILALALWNLTEPLAHLGQHAAAAQLMGFAERFWQERYGPIQAEDASYRDMIHALASAALGSGQAAAFWTEGERLSLSGAVALALNAHTG